MWHRISKFFKIKALSCHGFFCVPRTNYIKRIIEYTVNNLKLFLYHHAQINEDNGKELSDDQLPPSETQEHAHQRACHRTLEPPPLSSLSVWSSWADGGPHPVRVHHARTTVGLSHWPDQPVPRNRGLVAAAPWSSITASLIRKKKKDTGNWVLMIVVMPPTPYGVCPLTPPPPPQLIF